MDGHRQTYVYAYSSTDRYMRTDKHTYIHIYTLTHTCTHRHTYTHTYKHTNTHTHTHTHTRARAHTHTHTHIHTHTHTHDDSIKRNAIRCISPKKRTGQHHPRYHKDRYGAVRGDVSNKTEILFCLQRICTAVLCSSLTNAAAKEHAKTSLIRPHPHSAAVSTAAAAATVPRARLRSAATVSTRRDAHATTRVYSTRYNRSADQWRSQKSLMGLTGFQQ